MKALVIQEFGGPLISEETPIPQTKPDEVLVRVRTCAVDQFDPTVRDGKFPTAKTPIILGSRNVAKRELAEVVTLVAAGRVKPIVTRTYPLEEAEILHQRLRKQEIIGRVVLEP